MSKLLDIEKSAQRNIKSGLQYDSLFPPAHLLDEIINRDGNVHKTVNAMQDVVLKYLDDTRLIAPRLKGKTLEETCRNIWEFIYWHCQYKLDEAGVEQLRRPARSWYDRFRGIDCDDNSIFASSILTNLNITHSFRIAKYLDKNGNPGDWQHVYVVVPKPNGGHYTIDCVAHHFNYEKQYIDKIDHHMTQLNGITIAVLSVLDNTLDDELYGILTGVDFAEIERLEGLGEIPSEEQELQAICNHLTRTRDYILKNPKSVFTVGGSEAHLGMLSYAIDNWHTPNRDNALDILEQEEERWNQHNGVSGLYGDEDEINGLGASKAPKKFFKNVKASVKNVTQKAAQGVKKAVQKTVATAKTVAKKTGEVAKKVVQKAGEVAKKAIKAIVKYNPLSLAVRGGFLLAMKINLLDIAQKLYPAYLSESEAKAKGVATDKWQKAKSALSRIENLFVNKLQGKADKLKSAIVGGRAAKQFKGFGELGEPATIATVVAAAVPLITAYNEIKKAGLKGLGADEEEPTEATKTGFIQLIKAWWKKAFGKENATAPETVSEADTASNTTASESTSNSSSSNNYSSASNNNSLVKSESGDSSDNEEAKDEGGSGDNNGSGSGDGTWAKLKTFVKDNPIPVAIGATAVVTGIALGVRAIIKSKQKKQEKPATALSGYSRKKRKKNKPAHRKMKTIILK